MDCFYLVLQGGVRFEKFINVKQNNVWPKSKNKWQNMQKTQTHACNIGDVGAYDHFALRECLMVEIGKLGPA
jgi:hypothetical protein